MQIEPRPWATNVDNSSYLLLAGAAPKPSPVGVPSKHGGGPGSLFLLSDDAALTGLLEIVEMNYGQAEKLTRNAKCRPDHDGDIPPSERRRPRPRCRAPGCRRPLFRGDSMKMHYCPTHWHLAKEHPIYMAGEE